MEVIIMTVLFIMIGVLSLVVLGMGVYLTVSGIRHKEIPYSILGSTLIFAVIWADFISLQLIKILQSLTI